MEHCQLCNASLTTLFPTRNQTVCNGSQLQEIISKCGKYLSKDVCPTNINCNLPFYVAPFCEECGENTQLLVQLDLKLELVNSEIKQLIDRITAKILNERQNFQPINSETTHSSSRIDVNLFSEDQDVTSKPIGDTFDGWDSPGSNNSVYDSLQDDTSETVDIVSETVIASSAKSKRSKKSPKKQETADSKCTTKVTSIDLQLKTDSGGFACPNCHKKFTRLDILKRHDCGSQTYECETCDKSFSSKGSLQIHRRIHSGEKPHKCDTCGKGFTLPHHLRLHILTHTAEKPFQCDVCKKCFREKNYLLKHKVQHSKDENERRKYSCEICSKSFTLYQTLTQHLQAMHSFDARYKCKICDKACGTSHILRLHELTHSEEKKFKCCHCYKTFRSLDGVKNHELIHTGEKQFQCDICGSSFYSVPSLNMHINLKHLDDGDFICDICGKVYKTKLQLNQHRRHHDKKPRSRNDMPSKCVVCGKSYCDESNLIRHQRVAHVVTTNNSFICQKCGKDFEDFVEYRNHSRIRMSKRSKFRYKCDICDSIFPSRCDMISHFSENHTEAELPFKCSVCGSAFVQRNDLYRHRQQCDAKLKKKKVIKKRVKLKREKGEESGSEPDTVSSRKTKNNDSSKLRRSGRVRKRNKYFDEQSDKSSDSEVERSESESPENTVEVKIEDDFWVKQEPQEFSD